MAFVDFSILKNRSVQVILVSSGLSALGIYTPFFYLAQHMDEETSDSSDRSVSLVQCWLGVAFCCGCLTAGAIVVTRSRSCFISKRCLLRISTFGTGISLLTLYSVEGFYGYVMFSWLYGIFLGCYSYVSKTFCYSIVKPKSFSRTWSLVQAVQALPALLGIPITGYINESNDKTGYWFSLMFVCLGGAVLSFLPEEEPFPEPPPKPGAKDKGGHGTSHGTHLPKPTYQFPPLQPNGGKMAPSSSMMHNNLRHSVHTGINCLGDSLPLTKASVTSYSDPEGLYHSWPDDYEHRARHCHARPVSILKRQKTWHSCVSNGGWNMEGDGHILHGDSHLLHGDSHLLQGEGHLLPPPTSHLPPPPPPGFGHVVPSSPDVMVVDLITSTV